MLLTYYHAFAQPRRSRHAQRISPDFREFLSAFSRWENFEKKGEIKNRQGDHLYLLPTRTPNLYVFIGTRDEEIIKAINNQTLEVEDMRRRLRREESVGFASYIFIGPRFFAIASTVRGPKATSFKSLLKATLELAGDNNRHTLYITPVESISSREEALQFDEVRLIDFEVDPMSALGRHISGFFANDPAGLKGIRVIIKPEKDHNLRADFENVAERLPEDSVSRFLIKARAEVEEDLASYYLTKQGKLKDAIERGTESEILTAISTKVRNNPALHLKLQQLFETHDYSDQGLQVLTDFREPRDWVDRLGGDVPDGG